MRDHYKFFESVRVRFAETDMQGHVFFGKYLTYFDVALSEYLKAVGYSYHAMLAEGMDFFYIESLCQYKGRAFFDEILHVHVRFGEVGNTSFAFELSIFEESHDRLIATGRIVAVAVDRVTQNPVRVPEALRKAVENFEK